MVYEELFELQYELKLGENIKKPVNNASIAQIRSGIRCFETSVINAIEMLTVMNLQL